MRSKQLIDQRTTYRTKWFGLRALSSSTVLFFEVNAITSSLFGLSLPEKNALESPPDGLLMNHASKGESESIFTAQHKKCVAFVDLKPLSEIANTLN